MILCLGRLDPAGGKTAAVASPRLSPQHRHQFAPFAGREAAGFLLNGFAGEHALDHLNSGGGDGGGVHAVFEEGGVGEGNPALESADHRVGVGADFVLGVGVGAQGEEMHEVVQVGLPVPLRVEIQGQVHAGQLAGEAGPGRVDRVAGGVFVEHLGVAGIGALGVFAQQVEDAFGGVAFEDIAAALTVGGGLGGEVLGRGDVELVIQDGIARRV